MATYCSIDRSVVLSAAALIVERSWKSERMPLRRHFLMPKQGMLKFLSGVGKNLDSHQVQEVYDEEGGAIQGQRRREAAHATVQFYDVVHLSSYFGVSYDSALWRLKSLKLISEEERTQLAAQSEIAREFRRYTFLMNAFPTSPR